MSTPKKQNNQQTSQLSKEEILALKNIMNKINAVQEPIEVTNDIVHTITITSQEISACKSPSDAVNLFQDKLFDLMDIIKKIKTKIKVKDKDLYSHILGVLFENDYDLTTDVIIDSLIENEVLMDCSEKQAKGIIYSSDFPLHIVLDYIKERVE